VFTAIVDSLIVVGRGGKRPCPLDFRI